VKFHDYDIKMISCGSRVSNAQIPTKLIMLWSINNVVTFAMMGVSCSFDLTQMEEHCLMTILILPVFQTGHQYLLVWMIV